MHTEVLIKRVYDTPSDDDGLRVLVDKLWPRGIKKEDLKYDIWARDIAPSSENRRMFHANPEDNWKKFSDCYRKELESSSAFSNFIALLERSHPKRITLLYAFKSRIKNHAIVLQQEIMERLYKRALDITMFS